MSTYEKLTTPSRGEAIKFVDGEPQVSANPIIPYIRGDGTGVDIWPGTLGRLYRLGSHIA